MFSPNLSALNGALPCRLHTPGTGRNFCLNLVFAAHAVFIFEIISQANHSLSAVPIPPPPPIARRILRDAVLRFSPLLASPRHKRRIYSKTSSSFEIANVQVSKLSDDHSPRTNVRRRPAPAAANQVSPLRPNSHRRRPTSPRPNSPRWPTRGARTVSQEVLHLVTGSRPSSFPSSLRLLTMARIDYQRAMDRQLGPAVSAPDVPFYARPPQVREFNSLCLV